MHQTNNTEVFVDTVNTESNNDNTKQIMDKMFLGMVDALNNVRKIMYIQLSQCLDLDLETLHSFFYDKQSKCIDRNKITEFDNFPIKNAVLNGNLLMLEYLHQYGADIFVDNDILMCMAAENNHIEVVKYLHNNGVDINARQCMPFLNACLGNSFSIAKYLIDNGCQIENIESSNAADLAAFSGNFEVVRYLVDKKLTNKSIVFYYAIYFVGLPIRCYIYISEITRSKVVDYFITKLNKIKNILSWS